MPYQAGDKILVLFDQAIGTETGQHNVYKDTEGVVVSATDAVITARFTINGQPVDLPIMPMHVKTSDKTARDADLDLVRKATTALNQLQTDLNGIDSMNATQVRDVVKHMLIAEIGIIKALMRVL